MYSVYIQRALGSNAKVKKIFSLGGKNNVVKKSQDSQFVSANKPCLFIIDGDLDIACGKPKPKGENLHKLAVYCAENLLICEEAAIEICYESSADDSREAVAHKIDFDNWSKIAVKILSPLFLEYAVAYHCQVSGITTSNYNITQLLRGDELDSAPTKQRVRDRLKLVRREIIKQVGLSKYREARKHTKSIIDKNKNPLHLISGKTYLLPALHKHLRKRTDFRDAESAFRTRLAKHANLNIDKKFHQAIIKAATSR